MVLPVVYHVFCLILDMYSGNKSVHRRSLTASFDLVVFLDESAILIAENLIFTWIVFCKEYRELSGATVSTGGPS